MKPPKILYMAHNLLYFRVGNQKTQTIYFWDHTHDQTGGGQNAPPPQWHLEILGGGGRGGENMEPSGVLIRGI